MEYPPNLSLQSFVDVGWPARDHSAIQKKKVMVKTVLIALSRRALTSWWKLGLRFLKSLAFSSTGDSGMTSIEIRKAILIASS